MTATTRIRAKAPAGGARTIPSLDGLRALSIVFVIAAHWADTVAGRSVSPSITALLRHGGLLGVRVFFVISGFLITTLLLAEQRRRGRIELRRFYLRRTLRIFPPYYAYLATIAALVAVRQLGVPSAARWWPAWTYTANAWWTGSWYTGHAWSLSVEEQFYLTWPLALALLGARRSRRALIAVTATAPLARILIVIATGNAGLAYGYDFDFLAAGCALALCAEHAPHRDPWLGVRRSVRDHRRLVVRTGALIAAGCAVAALVARFAAVAGGQPVAGLVVRQLVLSQTAEAILFALAVAWCVGNASSVVGRALNSSVARRIGVLSYSLYLWQQLFLAPGSTTSTARAIGATIVAAMLSYHLIERPVLALRSVVERIGARTNPVEADSPAAPSSRALKRA